MNLDLWIIKESIVRYGQLLRTEQDEGKRTEIQRQQAEAWRRLAERMPKQK